MKKTHGYSISHLTARPPAAEIGLRHRREWAWRPATCRLLDSHPRGGENLPRNTRTTHRVVASKGTYMLAVIGNVIAGLGVLSLFTATLRLSKPRKRS